MSTRLRTRSIFAASAVLALAALTASPLSAQHRQHHQGERAGMTGQGHPMHGSMHGSMMRGSMMRGSMMDMGMMNMGTMGMMMGTGTMGGMQAMHPGPAMLLRASDALVLTAEQTEGLEELEDRSREEHERHRQAAMTARREAAAALEGESPDLDAYEEALGEAARHMVAAHLSMTRASLDAREILTPDQRDSLSGAASMMRSMHRTQGGRDMMNGGTMEEGGGM